MAKSMRFVRPKRTPKIAWRREAARGTVNCPRGHGTMRWHKLLGFVCVPCATTNLAQAAAKLLAVQKGPALMLRRQPDGTVAVEAA